jgi:hypothetical protein
LTHWKYANGRFEFSHFHGRSRSHSRKLARERRQADLLEPCISFYEVPLVASGSITYNRKGGFVRYSLPTRTPKVFRGSKR